MFIENRGKASKKRDEKLESKAGADENPWATASTKPAWHDASVEHIKVNIEDKSRLRKLKREEGETQITGGEYAQRLQEYYEKQTAASGEAGDGGDLFGWAKKPPASLISK
jgi:hypothetical protein